MASPKPITGIFAPLKKKIVNNNIKASGGNVKVVAPTTATSRANRNHNATIDASRAKSGSTAKQSGEFINAQNQYDKATGNSNSKVVPIRTSSGISGAGARNVAKLYRGGGIGMFGLPKNK
jgi:hypothetical protein